MNGSRAEGFDLVRMDIGGGLTREGSAESIVGQAVQSISNALKSSQIQLTDTVEKMNQTIKGCEARIASTEEINVVISAEQIVFSLKRSFEIAKDK